MKQLEKIKEKSKQGKRQFELYKYYFFVGVLSLIAIVILPMFGTDPDVGLNLPTTFVGWIVYVATKLCVMGINMSLFHCFMCQGKLNIKDNPKYLEACAILNRYGLGEKLKDPMGPDEWVPKQYKTKGVTVTITTLLSCIVLTQAILQFDPISMITYGITIIGGIIFGFVQQDTAECYWTDEFWLYAKKIEREMEAINANN